MATMTDRERRRWLVAFLVLVVAFGAAVLLTRLYVARVDEAQCRLWIALDDEYHRDRDSLSDTGRRLGDRTAEYRATYCRKWDR